MLNKAQTMVTGVTADIIVAKKPQIDTPIPILKSQAFLFNLLILLILSSESERGEETLTSLKSLYLFLEWQIIIL